jgi:hypothetical protein
VQAWRPPHLEVIDILGRRVDAQLERDTLQRGGGLENGDGIVEVGDVGGLRWAVVWRDQP